MFSAEQSLFDTMTHALFYVHAFLYNVREGVVKYGGQKDQKNTDFMFKNDKQRDKDIPGENIGGAICDVMGVTDCLTGYEIISDIDNYQRLESQIGFKIR